MACMPPYCVQYDKPADVLQRNRDAYVTNWDNLAWAVDVALARQDWNLKYRTRLKRLFTVWLSGKAVTDAVGNTTHTICSLTMLPC